MSLPDNNIILFVVIPLIIFVAPFFSTFLRVPTICVEMLLGSFVVFLGVSAQTGWLHIASEIGFVFLMFLAGLEVELGNVIKLEKRLIKPAIIYIGVIHLLSLVALFIFELPLITITILPLISIGIIATLKKDYGNAKWLELSFIIGTIAEIISILEFSIISNLITDGFTLGIFITIGYLATIIIITVLLFKALDLLFWWFPDIAHKLAPVINNQEKDIRLSAIILLGFCALMMKLHLEVALGAFIAGMFIRAFFVTHEDLIYKLEGVGFGFLVPLFFIYTGMSFDLSSLHNPDLIKLATIIALTMISIRLIASIAFKRIMDWRDIIKLGLSHSMPLSLLIGLVTIAYQAKSIDLFHFNAFILATLLEVLISVISIKLITNSHSK